MAIKRIVISLSLTPNDPNDPDSLLIVQALRAENPPKRQQSAVLKRWLAERLRGEGEIVTMPDDEYAEFSDLISKLDDL